MILFYPGAEPLTQQTLRFRGMLRIRPCGGSGRAFAATFFGLSLRDSFLERLYLLLYHVTVQGLAAVPSPPLIIVPEAREMAGRTPYVLRTLL